jgi:hypothetical protein
MWATKNSKELSIMVGKALAIATVLALAACSSNKPASTTSNAPPPVPDGTVTMHITQAAFIASGTGGSGTLTFHGQSYPFSVKGGGLGGIGASSVDATGEVYHLSNVSLFPGTYGQAQVGFAVGNASAGDMWLQNGSGVVMRLAAQRSGLMLSLGGSAFIISMSP